ncbi:hypothetical protein [Campylobacter majalis]|uniref:hypothetical protein n=1 Tax=Campylobacter majalis TaxID=2790656 RepID=UPI003D697F07
MVRCLTIFVFFVYFANAEVIKFYTDKTSSPILLTKAINTSIENSGAFIRGINEYQANEPYSYEVEILDYDYDRLSSSLLLNGIKVLQYENNNENFSIVLDIKNVRLNTAKIDFNSEIVLQKTTTPYIISLKGANSVTVRPNQASEWVADIRIYDRYLNQIRVIKNENVSDFITINIQANEYYAFIDDAVDINNIRGGVKLSYK